MNISRIWKPGKRSKSFYYKVLRNFLLLLLVPTLTIVVLYMQTEKLVKEQILLSSHNTLNQFFRSADLALEEMETLNINIAFNPEFSTYAMYSVYYEKKMPYQLYTLQNELKNMPVSKYKDVFIYYPHDNRVVSAINGSVSTDYYFKAYYEKNNENQREQFQKILNCTSKTPKLYAMNSSDGKVYLVVAMLKEHYSDVRQDYVVATMLSPEYLSELMVDNGAQQGNSILMFDKDKNLLFSSGVKEIALPQQELTEDYSGRVNAGENAYMLQVMRSKTLDGYYAVATPYDYFWQQLRTTRWIYGIGLLFSCLVGIGVSYRLSSRAYRPVGALVEMLQKQADMPYNREKSTEFEFVEALFEKENEKNLGLNQKIKRSQDAVLERFLISLLQGNVEEQSGDDVFERNGMHLYSDRFFVAVMWVGRTEYENMLLFILKNVFGELFDAEQKGYVVRLTECRFAIVVNLCGGGDSESLTELLYQGKNFLKPNYQMELSIGVGRIQEGMKQIQTAYREALRALQYTYLYGRESLIEYDTIVEREFQYPASSESRLFLLLTGYITGTDSRKTAMQFVTELLELYGIDENISMDAVECFRAEIKSTMNMVIGSRNYPVADRYEKIDELTEKETLAEFREAFAELLAVLRRKEREIEGTRDICGRAKEYIREGYMDPDLSLATVAMKLRISAPYLSRLFKEAYDISIPDFIARTRVQNAKEMLKGREENVADIAVKCGFRTGSIFIKTFKKWEGITPGVYKTLMESADVSK